MPSCCWLTTLLASCALTMAATWRGLASQSARQPGRILGQRLVERVGHHADGGGRVDLALPLGVELGALGGAEVAPAVGGVAHRVDDAVAFAVVAEPQRLAVLPPGPKAMPALTVGTVASVPLNTCTTPPAALP